VIFPIFLKYQSRSISKKTARCRSFKLRYVRAFPRHHAVRPAIERLLSLFLVASRQPQTTNECVRMNGRLLRLQVIHALTLEWRCKLRPGTLWTSETYGSHNTIERLSVLTDWRVTDDVVLRVGWRCCCKVCIGAWTAGEPYVGQNNTSKAENNSQKWKKSYF